MQKNPLSVRLNTSVVEVAKLLHTSGVSALPVVSEEGVVQGLVSERELFSEDYNLHYPTYISLLNQTDFVLGGNKNLPYEAERITRITAEEVMNRQVFFVPFDLELSKLVADMLSSETDLAPVVDTANHLLGTVSKGDLLKALTGVSPLPKPTHKPRHVDNEFDFVQKDLSSHFAMVAKARANIWVTTATVLFIVGFLAGMVYVVNPNVFFKKGSQETDIYNQ